MPDTTKIQNQELRKIDNMRHIITTTSTWCPRKDSTTLFYRMNCGIQMEKDMWYSVTPEYIAQHLALRVHHLTNKRPQAFVNSPEQLDTVHSNRKNNLLILDAFSGVLIKIGGNTIQFARFTSEFVIATDISSTHLKKLNINSKIYGVASFIDCVSADAYHLPFRPIDHLFDVMFLSPQWGGPRYIKNKVLSLEKSIRLGSQALFNRLAKSVVYYLPRNINLGDFECMTQKGKVLYLDVILNRLGNFVFPSNSVKEELTYSSGKVQNLCIPLSSIWAPTQPTTWSWRITVVIAFTGLLADHAYQIFARTTPSLTFCNTLSCSTFSQTFRCLWKYLTQQLYGILGFYGKIPNGCNKMSKDTIYSQKLMDSAHVQHLRKQCKKLFYCFVKKVQCLQQCTDQFLTKVTGIFTKTMVSKVLQTLWLSQNVDQECKQVEIFLCNVLIKNVCRQLQLSIYSILSKRL